MTRVAFTRAARIDTIDDLIDAAGCADNGQRTLNAYNCIQSGHTRHGWTDMA